MELQTKVITQHKTNLDAYLFCTASHDTNILYTLKTMFINNSKMKKT